MKLRNLDAALHETIRSVMLTGEDVVARGQAQREVIGFNISVERPTERVVLMPHRKNNIFAQVAETLWVIQGRSDMDYLTHYLPRAIDFSDDGKTWRAAYGPRLRRWGGGGGSAQLHYESL